MGYISRLIPFFYSKKHPVPTAITHTVFCEMHSSAFNLAESVEISRNGRISERYSDAAIVSQN